MEKKELLDGILSVMDKGDYEEAERRFDDLKNTLKEHQIERAMLEPEIGIIQASLYMNNGRMEEVFDIISKSMMIDPNNYELYYISAIAKENIGDFEGAYFDYKMSMYLGKDSKDIRILKNAFNHLCSYANANEYVLGKCCQKLTESRIKMHEYDKTSAFLSELIYDTNEVAAKTVLSEENMLLFMMLEIVLCERNNMEKEEFDLYNTCQRYKNCESEFKQVYGKIKLCCRRIWAGCSLQDQQKLCELLRTYPVSGDMLAVIIKYSVVQDVWIDTFQRVYNIIKDEFPEIAKSILSYYNWLSNFNLGVRQKCEEPVETKNDATVIRLNCQDKDPNIVCGPCDPNKIAIILCTNDEIYCNECNLYLQRLVVPDGMKVEIIEVRNATGMAAGYNYAMTHTDCKYKLYIHQDTFMIDRMALVKIVSILKNNEDIGMLGIAGTLKLNDNGFWWSSQPQDIRMNLYQDAILNILKSVSVVKSGQFEDAEAMDGILLATSEDVRWRDEVFDGWHFYDISQCYEFRKKGYRTALINDNVLWVMHETTMKKDEKNLYERYRTVFVNEYLNYDFGE